MADGSLKSEGLGTDGDDLPRRIGKYEVLGSVGRGAMGVVYEASDGESRTHVAIKAISGVSPEALYRFKREFRSLAEVRHRNVVSLYDLSVDGDRMFFTMELVRGRDFITALCGPTLGRSRTKHAPCTDFDALRDAMVQLAEGVRAIHHEGFLHRDIKPSNVLLTPEGRVVLLDFGLVRDIRSEGKVGVTADGAVLGTPLYMSPEQAEGAEVGPPSDWYSVGEMLYQALTGVPPYAGLGMLALLAAKKDDRPSAPSALCPGIPRDLDELCAALLSRDPEERPDADAVLEALGAAPQSPPPEDSGVLPFLGRDAELDRLRDAASATTRGRPVLVMVEGMSGIGKTALVHRFLRSRTTEVAGTVVLSGRCSERESIPYKALDAIMDQLSAFLRALPTAAEARAMLPRDVHALARLFPVLLGVPAVALTPARTQEAQSATEARRRGIEALRELFGRIADRHQLVVNIDDLQWSDVDSLAVLESILRHAYAPPMLFIGSFRQGAPERTEVLGRFLDDLGDIEPKLDIRPIRIGPMGIADATDLAMRLLGDGRHRRALAEEVAREADGSPFFVNELVRHAQRLERGDLSETDSAVSLDDVIRHRLRALPHDARRLLTVLAVAGGSLLQVVATRVALDDGFAREPVDRLRAESLIRTDVSDDQMVLEIYHDRIRETALRTVPHRELPSLHLGIAKALAETDRADAVALSHHFRQAGEEQEACFHTIAAADQAFEALAFDRAAELYRAALALEAVPDDERAEVEARFGESLANTGRLGEAGHALVRAADLANDDRSAGWRRAAAENFLTSGHGEEGRAVLDKALAEVGLALPTSTFAAVRSFLSQRAMIALRGIRYSVRPASEIEPKQLERLDALWTASRGLIYTDGLLGADAHARHLRLALKAGEPIRVSRALGAEAHLMVSLRPRAKLAKARTLLEQAEALVEQADDDYGRGMLFQHRGHVALMIGDFTDANDDLQRAIETFRTHTTGNTAEVGYCEAHQALCLQFLGRVQALAGSTHDLLRGAIERANPYVEGFARGILGHYVYLSADRHEEAKEQLEIYRDQAPRRFQAHQLNYVSQYSAYLRYVGRVDDALQHLEKHAKELEAFDLMRVPQARCEFLFARGQCALAVAARTPDNAELLARVRGYAKQLLSMKVSFRRAYGHLLLASVASLTSDTETAAAHLRQAIAAFERHQMGSFEFVARRRLAELVGGSEGDSLREQADAYCSREGIAKPEKFLHMITPGFQQS